MSPLDDLDGRIERAERIAMGKAMCGQWTKVGDEALAALYDERRRLHEWTHLGDCQLAGFACVVCGNEIEPQRPVGSGPRGQLFECVRHENGADDE